MRLMILKTSEWTAEKLSQLQESREECRMNMLCSFHNAISAYHPRGSRRKYSRTVEMSARHTSHIMNQVPPCMAVVTPVHNISRRLSHSLLVSETKVFKITNNRYRCH